MELPLFHVDAFTDKPFGGNTASVCLLPGGVRPKDSWMQSVALEMNHSETAFVQPEPGGFHLRWFTPAKEVDLCGHATLASSHVLWQEGIVRKDQPVKFRTLNGTLTCRSTPTGIAMDFPADKAKPAKAPAGLWSALGITPAKILRDRLDFLITLEDEAAVHKIAPDFSALRKISQVRGFIATAPAKAKDDYVCRYFAPAFGIDEDPATGSIQCTLGPYWSKKLGKQELTMRQLSRRGGAMRVRPEGAGVILTGNAVTTMKGTLTASAQP